jgi:hypothetical protein
MVDENVADATEEWRPIIGWEDRYEISTLGRVRGINLCPWYPAVRILKLASHHSGYKEVALTREGRSHSFRVHRLVAAAFLGQKPWPFVVNHKNGDKHNNHVRNLEVVTRKQNTKHAVDNRLSPVGERQVTSKLSAKDVIEIRALAGHVTLRELSDAYGVCVNMLLNITKRRSWRHIPEGIHPNDAYQYACSYDESLSVLIQSSLEDGY